MGIVTVILLVLVVAISALFFKNVISKRPTVEGQTRYGRLLTTYTKYTLVISCVFVVSFLLEGGGVTEREDPSQLFGWFGRISVASFVSLIVLVPMILIAKVCNAREPRERFTGSQLVGLGALGVGVAASVVLIGGALLS